MSAGQIVTALEQMHQEDLVGFVDELQKHRNLAEDLYDLLAFQMRAAEPVHPFEEVARS
jgi:hypothetical protein